MKKVDTIAVVMVIGLILLPVGIFGILSHSFTSVGVTAGLIGFFLIIISAMFGYKEAWEKIVEK
ncbi:MAG: hypothetical protein HYW70_00340 [Candidatus Nealsonbacteria bacterium]|nr:hypothetical protein [Candidatus Nealsonbacteria bacterium]